MARSGNLTRRSADWSRKSADEKVEELNLVLLGARKVGKSSLVSQFLWRRFIAKYKETVEDFNWIEYEIDGNKTFFLKIVDTSGSGEFVAMRDYNIQRADAFLVVFAVDDVDSLDEAKELIKLVATNNNKHAPVILVANKCDLLLEKVQSENGKRHLDWNDVAAFAIESNCTLMKVSAKDYDSVESVFRELLLKSPLNSPNGQIKKRRQSYPVGSDSDAYGLTAESSESIRNAKNGCALM